MVDGCQGVFHKAPPFYHTVSNPQVHPTSLLLLYCKFNMLICYPSFCYWLLFEHSFGSYGTRELQPNYYLHLEIHHIYTDHQTLNLNLKLIVLWTLCNSTLAFKNKLTMWLSSNVFLLHKIILQNCKLSWKLNLHHGFKWMDRTPSWQRLAKSKGPFTKNALGCMIYLTWGVFEAHTAEVSGIDNLLTWSRNLSSTIIYLCNLLSLSVQIFQRFKF